MPKRYHQTKTSKGTTIFRYSLNSHFWYCIFAYSGKQHSFNLGNDKKEAAKLADKIANYLVFHTIDEAREHFYPADQQVSVHLPTFKEVILWFRKAAKINGLTERTTENYVETLRRVALLYAPRGRTRKETKLFASRALNKPITCLNRQAWEFFVTEASNTRGLTASSKRTLNTMLANIKAMFCEHHTVYFPYWNPEWVEEFVKIPLFRRVSTTYRLPPERLIVDTLAHLHLMDPRDPVRTVIVLALRAGMRRSEIINAKKDWVELHDNLARIHIVATDDFTPKGTPGFTEIESAYLDEALASPGSYLLGEVSERERVDEIPMSAVSTLRSWGWEDYSNPLHEMRKIYGSVVASTRGLFAAQALLRHKNSQVTSDNYADLILGARLLEVWGVDAKKIQGNRPRSFAEQLLA